MFQAVYIEEDLFNHHFVERILSKYPHLPHIFCKRYTEVFNRTSQNFRLQKQFPALILARKFQNFVLQTPEGFGIGGKNNYYFSHMLNCIFDCRYCFLQGLYRSGNYVIFVNFENFLTEIQKKLAKHEKETVYFFSGYDCDSLALENITHFMESFLPFFAKNPRAYLELRTKSIAIQFLKKIKPIENCIVAYTLTPSCIAKAVELRTPSIKQRLSALATLQKHGWPIGIRFDPLIYCNDYQALYDELFDEVFTKLSVKQIHSVSLGVLRFPKYIYKTIRKLYPEEKLLAHSMMSSGNLVSYEKEKEEELINYCEQAILKYVPKEIVFSVQNRKN